MAVSMTVASGFRFRAALAVTFFIMFGYGLILPTLPLFATSLGVAETGAGLVVTVFAATRLAASLFAGSLIERTGERVAAALGAGIVGASSFAAGFSPNYPSLVLLRGFGGVGSAFFLAALMSSLLGSVEPERRARAMSMFWAIVGVGFILGPVFGGLLAPISLRAPLFAYGVICLAAAPLCYAVLGPGSRRDALAVAADAFSEESLPAPSLPAWRRLRPLLSDSAYRAALVAGAASFFVMGGVDTMVPLVWHHDFGLAESTLGLPFMLAGLATLGPAWHAGRLADRRGRRFATIPALAASAAGIALLGLAGGPVAFAVTFTLVGLAWGYQRSGPSAIVGDVSTDADRPIAVGGFRVATDAGALAGPIVVGAVAEHVGHSAAFVAAAGAAVVAFLVMLTARETAPAVARRAAADAAAGAPDAAVADAAS